MKPVIAILTSGTGANGLRGNRGNFRDLLRAARAQATSAYVVTAKDLASAFAKSHPAPYVRGYRPLAGRGAWAPFRLPLADVIYNRIPTRRDEQNAQVRQLIERLHAHYGPRFFNPRFFNKWQLAQWLRNGRDDIRKHVPDTVPLRNASSLRTMLDRHQKVFLKPINGKAGAGMMTVTRLQNRRWLLAGQGEKQARAKPFTDFRALWATVRKWMHGRSYIVQQHIELMRVRGAMFDLRLLLQKNSRGQWTVTGIGARVAGARSITTHVPRGGSIASPLRLLAAKSGRTEALHIIRSVGRTAANIAREIEQQAKYTLGEMSMDIGLDERGTIWFFEANARPMKFDEPLIRRRSLRKWVRYCRFLAAQRNHSTT
jgi:hypothetical protein